MNAAHPEHRPHAWWTRTADTLLRAPRTHATERHALMYLPGPASANGRWSDGLEDFARTFLLAAFRLAGTSGTDPDNLAEWYARGIAGADPARPASDDPAYARLAYSTHTAPDGRPETDAVLHWPDGTRDTLHLPAAPHPTEAH